MLGKKLRRSFRRATGGSAAIEFAMIAPVFFLLFFAILETGMVYLADMVLEDGLRDTARLLRTGQAQTASMTQAQFRQSLCDQISFLLSCATNTLYVDVRAFSSFGGSSYPQALDSSKNLNASNLNTYQAGSSSQVAGATDIVLVRAFYTWQLLTPIFSNYYSNMTGSKRLLSSSVAFRTEPY